MNLVVVVNNQRKYISKDLANLYAEWENSEGIKSNEEKTVEKPTIKLTCEMVLTILRRISDEDVTFMGFNPYVV